VPYNISPDKLLRLNLMLDLNILLKQRGKSNKGAEIKNTNIFLSKLEQIFEE
jgi:hypothetical protein